MSDSLVRIGPVRKRSGGGGEALRLVATLGGAALLSGLAIVGAFRVTLARIQANQEAALTAAVFQVLPGTTKMERLTWDGTALVPVEGRPAPGTPLVYAGRDAAGRLVGYAVPGEGPGFQDTIRLLYGVDPVRRRIVGLAILESRETPGLGDRIFKDATFVAEWADLAVDPAVELIKGKGPAPNQVDAITGATISSAAVVKIVNAANATWLERLPAADPASAGGLR